MRTHLRHLRPVLLVLVAAVLVLAGCSDDSGDDESGSDAATDDSAGSGDAGESASGDAVTIAGFAFDPDGLTVAAGTTVTFTNDDSAAHTATAEDDSFDTGELEGGDTAEVTFDEPGEVSYFCNIHNYMQGTVTVE